MNGYWNVFNRDGEEFKIQVKNEHIPNPSQFEGEVCCEFQEMFWLTRPEMCCPEIIYVERKTKDNIVIKKYGIASEIWMRDTKKEDEVLLKKAMFVELMEK